MNEVDFSGWQRTEENINRAKKSRTYRASIHWKRFFKAIKQGRWGYFSWWNLRGLLFNETKQL